MEILDELKEVKTGAARLVNSLNLNRNDILKMDDQGFITSSAGHLREVSRYATEIEQSINTIIARLESPELVEEMAKAMNDRSVQLPPNPANVTPMSWYHHTAKAALQAVLGGEKFKRVRLDQAND